MEVQLTNLQQLCEAIKWNVSSTLLNLCNKGSSEGNEQGSPTKVAKTFKQCLAKFLRSQMSTHLSFFSETCFETVS